ncbi:DUF4349 domain-containing protein [Streptomyces sp. BE303]|uniref:DUF4349 domain-containing protein n=1 Tax=Streptomyces sp. BE303 TaxID=3002528 RepID=UPI002E77574E|nr:DUF4349 domain-containing protein [Streptomyces sp. BE303]
MSGNAAPAVAGDAAAPAAAPAAPAAPGAAGAASAAQKAAPEAGAGKPNAVPVADTRQIAYSAQLSVRVAKADAALARARDLAVGAGGYVASETVSGSAGVPGGGGGGKHPVDMDPPGPQSGQLTVKVPSAAFQQTLDQLAGLGEVLSRRSQADDLTQQVADVGSRVQTQQVSVDRVRALMAQAKTLAEITSLEGELSRREADLESLQKQLKELSAKTSLSTITLDVRQRADTPAPDEPDAEDDDGFWTSVGDALGGGWDVLAAIVRGVAVAVAAAAPFLLVAGPVALVLWVLRRRRRAGAGTAPVTPVTPDGQGGQGGQGDRPAAPEVPAAPVESPKVPAVPPGRPGAPGEE